MSHFRVFALGATHLYILSLVLVGVASAQTPLDQNTTAQLEEYCVGCHNSDDYAGSLDLSAHLADADVSVNTQTWEKVIRKLRAGMMPPRTTTPRLEFLQ